MFKHMFNKLTDSADIISADLRSTVLAEIAIGIEELSGKALELAQLRSSEVTVRFTARWNAALDSTGFVYFEGALYPIDYVRDPGTVNPDPQNGEVRRGLLLELYAHRINDGAYVFNSLLLENGTDALFLEDGSGALILEG